MTRMLPLLALAGLGLLGCGNETLNERVGNNGAGGAFDTTLLAPVALPNLLTNQTIVLYLPTEWHYSIDLGVGTIEAWAPTPEGVEGSDSDEPPLGLILTKGTANGTPEAILEAGVDALVGTTLGAYTITEAVIRGATYTDTAGAIYVAAQLEDANKNKRVMAMAETMAIGVDGETLHLALLGHDEDVGTWGGVEMLSAVMGLYRDQADTPDGTPSSPTWVGQATQAVGTAMASAGGALYTFLDDHMSESGFSWDSAHSD